MIVTEVDIVGMPIPLTQKCRFRALAGLVARQKILLNLPEIKELNNDDKWDLFDKHVQKHLKFQEDAKPQAFKLFWKMAAKAWRQFRFQLRKDFIRKGLERFTRHCWWRSGPKGGRRHNSPQSSLTPLAYYHEGRYFYLRKEGRCRKLNNTKWKQENTQQTEDRKN
jgi:hypothetical protein